MLRCYQARGYTSMGLSSGPLPTCMWSQRGPPCAAGARSPRWRISAAFPIGAARSSCPSSLHAAHGCWAGCPWERPSPPLGRRLHLRPSRASGCSRCTVFPRLQTAKARVRSFCRSASCFQPHWHGRSRWGRMSPRRCWYSKSPAWCSLSSRRFGCIRELAWAGQMGLAFRPIAAKKMVGIRHLAGFSIARPPKCGTHAPGSLGITTSLREKRRSFLPWPKDAPLRRSPRRRA